MRGLRDKTAIVTGGGGAIGRAICTRLASEGCRVGILDRDGAAAGQTASATAEQGTPGIPITVDITDYDAVRAAVEQFQGQAGPTDILVNNAGWDRVSNFLDTEPSFWDDVLAINLRGPLIMHHVVVKGMAERGAGKVVNIASDAGRVGSSGEAVYAAAKGGIIAFTKTLARELAPRRINLNVVCPGPTDTPLLKSFLGTGEQGQKIHDALVRSIPFKRLGQPGDIAGIVAFLASDEASYMTGQVISVSGGLTMHG